MKNSLIDVLSRAMTGVLLLQIPNLVRDDEGDFYTALREPQGPGVFVLRRDFFFFLANQYRAMEGDLAARRFSKGSAVTKATAAEKNSDLTAKPFCRW